jgi:hypothetical protein
MNAPFASLLFRPLSVLAAKTASMLFYVVFMFLNRNATAKLLPMHLADEYITLHEIT